MRRRAEHAAPLPIKALYSVAEVADAAGMTRQSIHRLLFKNGVQTERCGRTTYVALSEIEKKMPHLWESMKLAVGLRRAVGG